MIVLESEVTLMYLMKGDSCKYFFILSIPIYILYVFILFYFIAL